MGGNIGRSWNPLVKKLSLFSPLSDEDVGLLNALCAKEERFRAGEIIAVEGDAPRSAFVVTHGMAFRYRLLPDGRRQILTFLIPGDFFDLHVFLLKTMDHSISTIGPTRIAPVGRDVVIDIVAHHPRIGAALWWSAMQEEAMLRERIVALGRRSAPSCVAYLLCELVLRQRVIGMAGDHAIRLPLTQTDLADALGLTSVHVDRVLQRFRRDQLLTLEHRRLNLRNGGRLEAIAGFMPNYLQLNRTLAEVIRYLDELESARAGSGRLEDA